MAGLHASRALLVAALALALFSPEPATAQDTPVVFLHGVQSSPNTWRDTAAALDREFRISPYIPETNWRADYETQARSLQARLGHLPGSTVVVGHSSGGIVAREWSKQHPFQAIVTMGTPHHGAHIANNWPELFWETARFSGHLQTMLDRVRYTRWSFMIGDVRYAVSLGDVVQGVVYRSLSTYATSFLSDPIYRQIGVGSAYLRTLNHPDTVYHEQRRVGRRISIAYDYPRLALDGPASAAPDMAAGYRYFGLALYGMLAGWYPYAFDGTIASIDLRNAIGGALRYLTILHPLWCFTVTGNGSCGVPADGVVATASQDMPGGVTVRGSHWSHTQQTTAGYGDLRRSLIEHVGLRTRSGGVPPPTGSLPPPALRSGEHLFPGQEVWSPGSASRLIYQADGNLVVYSSRGAIWHSATAGSSPGMLAMQGDGNLVLYNAGGQPIWSSGTNTYPGAYVTLDDAGGFRVVSEQGVTVWWGVTP